jgi:hypothetical protein
MCNCTSGNDGRISIRDTSAICSQRRVLICPSGGFLTGLSSPISGFPKNISVPTHPKSDLELFASHPTRGAYRDRHGRGVRMRWTRQRFARDGIAGRVERLVSGYRHADERRFSRTAKSCGPDAPTLASSSRSFVWPNRAETKPHSANDGGKRARSPGSNCVFDVDL